MNATDTERAPDTQRSPQSGYTVPRMKIHMVRDGDPIAVRTPDAAAEAVRALCCEDPATESMVVLFVDGRSQIRGATVIAQGGRGSLMISAAEVLRPALVAGAHAIIIGHNHPSGSPRPSAEDDAMTASVHAAADVVGVPLLDHVIVTDDPADGTTSYMAEERGVFS